MIVVAFADHINTDCAVLSNALAVWARLVPHQVLGFTVDQLFVAKGFYRVQQCGTTCWVGSKEDANAYGEGEGKKNT